ncbi:leucine-rich repeat-containing protein 15-like [Saccostrea echinata]|uniref:leucine-rich repeat-containing protein 15-like n=1 Tax=Saccostrea echinata TaxID=191078 RepID=UPI002A83DD8D|nr:leucine-rich repeat-containing protein 15-like [Saccostrea echinata]
MVARQIFIYLCGARMNSALVVSILLLQVGFTLSCPTTSCTCETVSSSTKRVIRCRDLNAIPTFSPSAELFLKLDLDSASNNIQVLQANAFQGIRLEEIDLTGEKNQLQSIHPLAFSGLQQDLKTIRLRGDSVLPPPFSQMQNLTNLQELHLKNFNMPRIERSSPFHYFPNLLTLRLREMQTTFVSAESFMDQLEMLKRFEFANNNVPTFPKPAINRLRTLEHLSWLHNEMETIPNGIFSSLSNLIELDLRGNQIASLDYGCFNGITEKLEFLGLQINKLNEHSILPLGNHTWPKLEQLSLGHMQIDFQDIPSGLFKNMPKLANLMMPGNKLKEIKSNDFEGLRSMHSLDLSENYIKTIQKGALAHMPLLDTLDLRAQYDVSASNPLNFSLDIFQGTELALKTLYIQDNHLIEQHAWDAIGAMKNLRNLDISKTKLSNIPSLVFYSHNQLGSLKMQSNDLSVLRQESLYGLKDSLESIDIAFNKINVIDECVFEGFSKLMFLFALGNSLACNCNLYGLYQHLKIINSTGGYTQVPCSSPPNLATKELLDLPTSDFCTNLPTLATCPEFTTTTVPPSTTTITTTSIPVPDIQLVISNVNEKTIVISWTVVGDMTYLKNFRVQYKQLGVDNPEIKTFPIDISKRDHPISGLLPASRYQICFYIDLTDSTTQKLIGCLTQQTKPEVPTVATTAANTGSDNTGTIVGGVLGGFLLIALVVLVFVLYIIWQRRNKEKQKPPPLPPATGNVMPIAMNQHRPTSQPKVYIRKANGELEVMTISNGVNDSSRFSAGSYQNVDLNAVSNDPYPTKGATGGEVGAERREPSKQQHVKLPPENKPNGTFQEKPRYTQMPGAPSLPNTHYINEVNRMAERDHYSNGVETRPLPQTPNSQSISTISGGGFLNHGFSSSPTETVYNEIDHNNTGTVV